MRRQLRHWSRKYTRSSSFVGGLFNYKVVSDELVPFPSRTFSTDEAENTQTLIEQIRGGDSGVVLSMAGSRIAVEYGGLGLGHTAYALVCEEIGTSGEGKLLTGIQHCGMASHLLSSVASSDLRGKYFTTMSDGSVMMGWAIKEESGADVSMNTTTAALEGGIYRITGKKICYFAESVTHFMVMAKTLTQTAMDGGPVEGHRNSFFIIKKDAEGKHVMTLKDTVVFDHAPAEDIVGVVGEGFKDFMVTLFTEEYVYAAAMLGTFKRVVQELRVSVPDRWATATIASCACVIYAMESAVYALTANLDVPTDDSLLESALVCAFVQSTTNEWLTRLSTTMPMTEAMEGCFSCARTLLNMMESLDFLYSTAVCCGVEDFGLIFQRTATLQMMQARLMRSLNFHERLPIREIDCTAIDKAMIHFGHAVEKTFVRNATRVPYQQLIINRLGKAASLLYTATATASHALMSSRKRSPTAKTERELAAAFINFASGRADQLSYECCNIGLSADDSYKRIALELCEDMLQ